jgi:hypothetical protein
MVATCVCSSEYLKNQMESKDLIKLDPSTKYCGAIQKIRVQLAPEGG